MAQAERRPFGRTPGGEQVDVLTLYNGSLRCEILTLGATLRTLEVPARGGARVDVVLGYDRLEDYLEGDGYLGAVVGRCANRIAGGRFTLNGRRYQLAVNNGPNHLHGGLVGFSHRVWQVRELAEDRAVLALHSPDGEEGYPGSLDVQVTYRLDGGTLELHYEGLGGGDTVCNLTNHSYFNLSGHGAGPVLDQRLQLFARRYLPTDPVSIPLGEEPVEGTPMDFLAPTPIGARLQEDFVQLRQAGGYDHCYVVDGRPGVLRPAARAWSDETGILLQADTTQPGVQLYTANFVDPHRPGKGGAAYGPHRAFCLETQGFPDAVNHPQFPSWVLRAGEKYDQVTRYSFSVFEV